MQVSGFELQVYRKLKVYRHTPFFYRQARRLSYGKAGGRFRASLAFVFFPAIVSRAYTLPAVRYPHTSLLQKSKG